MRAVGVMLTDIRGLDHADIVGTITNGKRHSAGNTVLNELDDERLLLGRYTAAYDRLAECAETQQQVLVLSVRESLESQSVFTVARQTVAPLTCSGARPSITSTYPPGFCPLSSPTKSRTS